MIQHARQRDVIYGYDSSKIMGNNKSKIRKKTRDTRTRDKDSGEYTVKIGHVRGLVAVGGSENKFKQNAESTEYLPDVVREEYIQKLKKELKNLYAVKEAWMIPIPDVQSTKHRLTNFYVEPDISLIDINWCEFIKSPIPFQKIFCPHNEPHAPKSILLVGEAGYGKSTLCLKLINDWLGESKSYMSTFEIVFLIRLRDIKTTTLDEILSLCNRARLWEYERKKLLQCLNSLDEKLLLIFDGYDEATEETKCFVKKLVDYDSQCSHDEEERYLKAATIFVTSRMLRQISIFTSVEGKDFNGINFKLNYEISEELQEEFQNFERILSLNSLSADVTNCYIDKFFKSEHSKSKALKEKLSIISNKMQLSPMLLFIMCKVYNEGYDCSFGALFWEQYLRLISRRFVCRDKTALSEALLGLGKLCLQCLVDGVPYFEPETVSSLCGDLYESILTCGIFVMSFSFSLPFAKLEIVHSGLIEHLACNFLNNTFTNILPVNLADNLEQYVVSATQSHKGNSFVRIECFFTLRKFSIVFHFCNTTNKLPSIEIVFKNDEGNNTLPLVSFRYFREGSYSFSKKYICMFSVNSPFAGANECIKSTTKALDFHYHTKYLPQLIKLPDVQCRRISFFVYSEGLSGDYYFFDLVYSLKSEAIILYENPYNKELVTGHTNGDEETYEEKAFWNEISLASMDATALRKNSANCPVILISVTMGIRFFLHWQKRENVVVFIDSKDFNELLPHLSQINIVNSNIFALLDYYSGDLRFEKNEAGVQLLTSTTSSDHDLNYCQFSIRLSRKDKEEKSLVPSRKCRSY